MATPTKETPRYNNPFRFTFPGLDGSAVENGAQAYKAWLQCMMTMSAETTKFVTKRLQRDAQLPLNILRCHTPQDVMQAQVEFLRTMAEDYTSEADRLGRIVSESFHSIDRPPALAWPQPVEEAVDDRSTKESRKAA
ncbi:MAG: phasin family protein [Alphaproteobacteria bacterium]|nr:phasin family protein [Alphaproteobacteria bacterium]